MLLGRNKPTVKIPLPADTALIVLRRGIEIIRDPATATANAELLVRIAHVVGAFMSFTRHDTISNARVFDVEPNDHGLTFTYHKLKNVKREPPRQQLPKSLYISVCH